VPVLGRCRLAALRAYGAFAAHYVDDFHREWIGSPAEDPLGSPDIQSLADLQGSFQVVQEMRLVVWDRRILLTLGLAALMPMLPLVIAAAPVGPLLRRVIRMLL